MAGLKELRTRISSITSTQKITSAMKMVAAARLKRAQELLSRSKNYNDGLLTIVGRLYKELKTIEKETGKGFSCPLIMQPRSLDENYLLVVFTSDRGLCGSYNAYVVKETLRRVNELQDEGKKVKVLCIGKKIGDALRARRPEVVADVLTGVAAKGATYKEAEQIVEPLIKDFLVNEFDACEVIYTYFNSAINREIKHRRILPFELDIDENDPRYNDYIGNAFYEYDAPLEKIFNDAVFMLIVSEMFQFLVNSQASEHGARMTSMDNATRNASDIISKLTLRYNRLRQSAITTELIEIISGAEAL